MREKANKTAGSGGFIADVILEEVPEVLRVVLPRYPLPMTSPLKKY